MNVLFDFDQLFRLVTNLYTITGIQANILNSEGRDISLPTGHAPFCTLINALPEGHDRCVSCDRKAVECLAGKTTGKNTGFHFYRCHAGICEAICPLRILESGPPPAYLIFGQYLDSSPLEAQWEQCRKTLDWWKEDLENLRKAFFRFRQYSEEELLACSEILQALSAHILHNDLILTTDLTDVQKLEMYLNQHYREKLTLDSIAAQLQIGRTRLCKLAKELSGGKTVSQIITCKRIQAAQNLLLQSNQPVSVIAETIGIGDYNYFSKVFRSCTGTSPTAFRRANRDGTDRIRRNFDP